MVKTFLWSSLLKKIIQGHHIGRTSEQLWQEGHVSKFCRKFLHSIIQEINQLKLAKARLFVAIEKRKAFSLVTFFRLFL